MLDEDAVTAVKTHDEQLAVALVGEDERWELLVAAEAPETIQALNSILNAAKDLIDAQESNDCLVAPLGSETSVAWLALAEAIGDYRASSLPSLRQSQAADASEA